MAPNPKIASPGSNPKIRFSISFGFTKPGYCFTGMLASLTSSS
jgi:hypothetical protein